MTILIYASKVQKKYIFRGPEFIHGTLSLIVYCTIRYKKKKDVSSKIYVLSWVLCNLMITTTCTMQGRTGYFRGGGQIYKDLGLLGVV